MDGTQGGKGKFNLLPDTACSTLSVMLYSDLLHLLHRHQGSSIQPPVAPRMLIFKTLKTLLVSGSFPQSLKAFMKILPCWLSLSPALYYLQLIPQYSYNPIGNISAFFNDVKQISLLLHGDLLLSNLFLTYLEQSI